MSKILHDRRCALNAEEQKKRSGYDTRLVTLERKDGILEQFSLYSGNLTLLSEEMRGKRDN